MAQDKKSFLLYADWRESFDDLTDEEAGILIKHIFKFVNDEDPELEDRLLKQTFIPMRQQLERDLEKWREIRVKRSEAGRKGGKAKQANARSVKQKQANQAVIVNDNVNVTVNDTVINNIGGFSQDFKSKWIEWLEYKKQFHKFTYKTTQSEEAAIRKLSSLGGGSENKMIKIIDESIAHGWKGFHNLKEEKPNRDEQLKDWRL